MLGIIRGKVSERAYELKMKRAISIALMILLLIVAGSAYAVEEYDGVICEGITEEEYYKIRYYVGTGIKEADIVGYMESFDIDPQNGNICICYHDSFLRKTRICVYDRNQKFLYGASITEDSLSCTSWIDGKLNIFVSETLYSYVLNDSGKLERIIDCYEMDMMRNTYEQTRQEVNGVTYKLKKGNIFLPGDYISLVRINGDGSEEVVIRCKHISDGEVIGSTIFSLFIISVILGIISVFVVEFVTWRRDMRAFFAKKRAEGLSEDEIHRQFAEHQREKNERVSSIFRPR